MYYGEDDGNQEKPRSGYLDFEPRFESRTTEIRNRNATHLTATFRGNNINNNNNDNINNNTTMIQVQPRGHNTL
jgi:hypothetical protein